MSLVAYGSSDESDEEDVQSPSSVVAVKKPEAIKTSTKSSDELKCDKVDSVNTISFNGNTIKGGLNSETDSLTTGNHTANNISDDENELGNDDSCDLRVTETAEEKTVISLPAPKTKLHDIDFDWSRLTKGTKGTSQPIKISIPSLSELETDESSEPVKKKLKPSKKGSGLFALLPTPKNAFFNPTKNTLKPQHIQNKAPVKPSVSKVKNVSKRTVDNVRLASKLPSVNYDDSPDEDDDTDTKGEKVDFFSLSSSAEVPAADIQLPNIELFDNHNKKEADEQILSHNSAQTKWINDLGLSKALEASNQFSESVSSGTSDFTSPATSSASYIPLDQEDIQLDETALQQLCGRRDRQKGGPGFQIIDVNGDAIMPDAREWLTKQLTEEQNTNVQSHKKKDGPTTQQRRKHQITYLAFQAKEHELELKNQWANNRMSRKQTQAKYGF